MVSGSIKYRVLSQIFPGTFSFNAYSEFISNSSFKLASWRTNYVPAVFVAVHKSPDYFRYAFFCAPLPHGVWAGAAARRGAAAAEGTMKSMIAAIQANSLPNFVAPGDEAFQAGMTREMLSSINQSLASRLTQGYTSTFLTRLNQQGFGVYVWKLAFKDGNDDVLVFMAVKEGKVGGFWLR